MGLGAILGKAAAAAGKSKAFQHLGKIKSSQWKQMGGAFKEMSNFAKQGGVANFIGGTIETIKSRIKNQVIGMFSPVINEVTQFTADLLSEAEPLGKALGDFIGLLKDVSIQIGDVNVSLLDVILGFPLILKGLNAIGNWFSDLTNIVPISGIPPNLPPIIGTPAITGVPTTPGAGAPGNPSGAGGYQEF